MKLFLFIILSGICNALFSQTNYPYKNSHLPVEQRVKDLVSRMTILEKIKQLDMYWGYQVADITGHESTTFNLSKVEQSIGNEGVGSIHDFYPVSAAITNKIQQYAIEHTRLGIPVLFIEEGLHGYLGAGSTTFPIPLQLSSAWDTLLMHDIGRAIATETRAHGVDMLLAPVLDLARDPRWGRVEENYGEDPYLSAANGVAMVKGLQGTKLSDADAVIAEPKHFAVHSIPEGGSNTAPVNIGEREARSSFLYVFEKAVREGGTLAIMVAYSEIDGVPCVDNKWLLTDVLRKEWGFKGFVLSDLGAIKMTLVNHHVTKDTADALAQAFRAGLNMQFYDFQHASFQQAIQSAIENKQLTDADLDKAVSGILRVKFLLGLFDHPYTDTTLVQKVAHTSAYQQLALKAAQESIVLLKNDTKTLPLNKTNLHIALLGPLALSTYVGGYSHPNAKGISILDGLKQRAGANAVINYATGYDAKDDSAQLLSEAIATVQSSDVAVVVLGEESYEVGEGKDRANLDLSDKQLKLIKAVKATGKPVVALLFNGRPLSIDWVADSIPSIVETWFAGEQGGLAVADVLLGKINPSGKLPITFPRSVGQLPFYYNHKPTSYHRYVDEKNTPLFTFGHGLSYTSFEYSNLIITPKTITATNNTDVTVTIKNTGTVSGAEIAQLYINDVVSSVTTPEIALKGFARVELQPSESKTIHFTLTPEDLSLWNRDMKRVVEPGEFTVMVGAASDDIKLKGTLHVSDHSIMQETSIIKP